MRPRRSPQHRTAVPMPRRTMLRLVLRICQPVLASKGDRFHLALGHVVVDGQEARLGVTHQRVLDPRECLPGIGAESSSIPPRLIAHAQRLGVPQPHGGIAARPRSTPRLQWGGCNP
jgi:hypothetical protein